MFYQFSHPDSPDYCRVERGENFSFPPHLHACFEFVYLKSGCMQVTVDGAKYTLQAGDALFLFPHQIHSMESTESEHMLCIFSPQLVHAFAKKTAGLCPKENTFAVSPAVAAAVEATEDGSLFAQKGALYTLCDQFDRTAAYTSRARQHEGLLYKIFSFVETEFAADCSLGALAEATGYDYAYLSRRFRQAVGISFNTYVSHYRLSHACYLLENTNQSVLQCAVDSGYSSLRSFNRCFKAQFGVTPTEYRKT